jgi:hypothetical protein
VEPVVVETGLLLIQALEQVDQLILAEAEVEQRKGQLLVLVVLV